MNSRAVLASGVNVRTFTNKYSRESSKEKDPKGFRPVIVNNYFNSDKSQTGLTAVGISERLSMMGGSSEGTDPQYSMKALARS